MSQFLDEFESLVEQRKHSDAVLCLLRILHGFDSTYGQLQGVVEAKTVPSSLWGSVDQHLINRLVSAISALFMSPELIISEQGFQQLIGYQRWLATLFASSPLRNADHVLRTLNIHAATGKGFEVQHNDIYKFLLLYFPLSDVPLDLDNLWGWNPYAAASLGMALVSPRFLGEEQAYGKREQLLPWLSRKLQELDDPTRLPLGVLHDVYMHCSYSLLSNRHDIKAALNGLIRKHLASWGIEPLPRLEHKAPAQDGAKARASRARKDKAARKESVAVAAAPVQRPVMLVVVEWFTSAHSIYRTHSRTIEGARKEFQVIGMGFDTHVDGLGRGVFDEFIALQGAGLKEQIEHIRRVAQERGASVLYMPSVGMFPLTAYLANCRFAPVQAMALGHPATSRSDNIDYVVVEEDYVGDPKCFSEQLLVLPKDGMPYRPSAHAIELDSQDRLQLQPAQCTHIAIAATKMKLNPAFLGVCRAIRDRAASKVQFHFLIGSANGIECEQIRLFLRAYLGDAATFYPHQSYANYMRVVRSCDLFLNPFPFGNTNGIVDCVTAGLVGVCKTGPEVFEHIDEGMFGRIGFPSEWVSATLEAYVQAALALIADPHARKAKARELSGPKAAEVFFRGDANGLGRMLAQRLEEALSRRESIPVRRERGEQTAVEAT